MFIFPRVRRESKSWIILVLFIQYFVIWSANTCVWTIVGLLVVTQQRLGRVNLGAYTYANMNTALGMCFVWEHTDFYPWQLVYLGLCTRFRHHGLDQRDFFSVFRNFCWNMPGVLLWYAIVCSAAAGGYGSGASSLTRQSYPGVI